MESRTSHAADSSGAVSFELWLLCFSSMVGSSAEQNRDRLKTLLSTIFINKFAVIAASVLWFSIERAIGLRKDQRLTFLLVGHQYHRSQRAIFASILLGILVNHSARGNMLYMDRDRIVTAAAPDGGPCDLTHLNSSMRRTDLICKFTALKLSLSLFQL